MTFLCDCGIENEMTQAYFSNLSNFKDNSFSNDKLEKGRLFRNR